MRGGAAPTLQAGLILFLLAGIASGADLEVRILSPAAGRPAIGEVEVVADVLGAGPTTTVELILDGRSLGRLDRPPYRWIADLGERAVEHLLEVRAVGTEGATASVLEIPGLQIDEEIEVELVPLYVTVTRDGEPVDSLSREDFTLLDEGVEQEIITFERGDVPLTAALLLDASESMIGPPIESALAGAREFVRGMQPLDQAMLVLFSDRINRATPFTGFRQILEVGLEGVTPAGGTAINDNLFLALELLDEQRGRRVVVLLSDGLDIASAVPMREVLETGRRSPALIYWLHLPLEAAGRKFSSAWRSSAEHHEEIRLLERAVRRSGGQIVPLNRVEEALEAFRAILTELRGQYVLGYYPTEERDDGSWHPVRVRVSQPGLDVRYRDGYVDQ